MERAHRVGQRMDQRPRPIIAKFTRFCDREAILREVEQFWTVKQAETEVWVAMQQLQSVLGLHPALSPVSASMTGGGAVEPTPASGLKAAAVKEATPQHSAPPQGKTKSKKY
ncbi:hypothetical protein Pmani_016523 [Petrolisthes manimaculis]|uniref:Uncharacterized protein n=1 Tax=Petrolisthes manimaculis TaxID=1843537 RepID=A0AAE1PNS0_9EUCA|nr:hypothetical protein Pmani_016523 [Petrolisthes manimaculis]